MSRLVYRLQKKLNAGYTGTTYQGSVTLPDGEERTIVLKLLAPHFAQDSVILSHLSGFLDAIRGVAHHGYAPLWDFGRAGDYYFIVREYLPGISLHDLLKMVEREEVVISPAMACYIAAEIATGIYALHSHRYGGQQPIYLYHGGLTPKNVLLTRIGTIAIADAGQDVIFWRDVEYSSLLIQEKSAWQPPEYSHGQRPMRRNDTFSVASILYEMLTGPPLERLLQMQAPGVPLPPASATNKRVEPALDRLLAWALNPDVGARCNQIEQLHQGLLQPDLYSQNPVEKREAMDFIQALAKRELSIGEDSADALIFDYPFQLESLLPERSNLLPPWERYRPPVFENTDSYPQLNENESSEPEEFSLSTSVSVIFPEDELELLGASEGSGTSIFEQDEPTRAGAPLVMNDSTSVGEPPVESTTAMPYLDVLDPMEEAEPTHIASLEDIKAQAEAANAPAPPVPFLGDPISEAIAEKTENASLQEISEQESTQASASIEEIQNFPFGQQESDPSSTVHRGSAVLDEFDVPTQDFSEQTDEEEEKETSGTVPDGRTLPELPEDVVEIPGILLEGQDEEVEKLAQSYLASPELEDSLSLSPPEELPELEEPRKKNPFPTLPSEIVTNLPPPPPPIPGRDTGLPTFEAPLPPSVSEKPLPPTLQLPQEEVPTIEPTACLPIDVLEEEERRQKEKQHGQAVRRSAPTSTEARAQKGMEETIKGGAKLPEPTIKGAESVLEAPTEFETPAVPEGSPGTVPQTPAVSPLELASTAEPSSDHWLKSRGGIFGDGKQGKEPARHAPLPRTVALPIEAVEGYPGNKKAEPAPSTTELKDGEELFGKFLLVERVALGGMAEVFKARIEGISGFQRLLAVKRILPNYSEDPHFQRMFKDEARIAGSLMHPNIVQIHELGEYGGVLYISMEFIDGIDLSRTIKIRRLLKKPIAVQLAIGIAVYVCRALHYAHEARDLNGQPLQMIHRDVTPHNILLSKTGEVKITDFGVAKAAQNVSETAVGELKGKLSYLSPEQIHATPLTRSSDIYQLGILLYEMLTLRKMIEGQSDRDIFNRISQGNYSNLADIAPHVQPELRAIVEKALSLKPEFRYQSAQEMEAALLDYQKRSNLYANASEIAHFVDEALEQREQILSQQSKQREKHQFSVWDNSSKKRQQEDQQTPSITHPPASELMPQTPSYLQGDEVPTDELRQVASKNKPPQTAFPPPSRQSAGHSTVQEEQKKSPVGLMIALVIAAIILVSGTTLGLLWWLKPKHVALTVETAPARATVLIDGEIVGQTPLRNKKLPFDKSRHLLQIQKRGYRIVTRKFIMERGKPLRFKVTLPPLRPSP
jgi:serine/threonine protein kinase